MGAGCGSSPSERATVTDNDDRGILVSSSGIVGIESSTVQESDDVGVDIEGNGVGLVAWSPTPGAVFHAFASGVDNQSGDGIYVPAIVRWVRVIRITGRW